MRGYIIEAHNASGMVAADRAETFAEAIESAASMRDRYPSCRVDVTGQMTKAQAEEAAEVRL